MARLMLMTGIPGAGKSTLLKCTTREDCGDYIVSRDKIRFSLVKEGEEYFSKEDEVWKMFIQEIKDNLPKYDTVFVDATHLNEASRAKVLRALGSATKGVTLGSIFVDVPLELALKQNEQRKGTRAYVPQSVIKRMYLTLTKPTKEEGFDEIYVIRRNENGDNISD